MSLTSLLSLLMFCCILVFSRSSVQGYLRLLSMHVIIFFFVFYFPIVPHITSNWPCYTLVPFPCTSFRPAHTFPSPLVGSASLRCSRYPSTSSIGLCAAGVVCISFSPHAVPLPRFRCLGDLSIVDNILPTKPLPSVIWSLLTFFGSGKGDVRRASLPASTVGFFRRHWPPRKQRELRVDSEVVSALARCLIRLYALAKSSLPLSKLKE